MKTHRLIVKPLAVVVLALLLAPKPAIAQGAGSFRYTENLPIRFSSHAEAEQSGCDFARVEGPAVDACVLTGFGANQMDIFVYERSDDGSYPREHHIVITSWYWGAKLSFLDVAGTDWLAIDTEGMRGTGIAQNILLIVAWDGSRFRTVAEESLNYRCSRPTSQADYQLNVQRGFGSTNGALSLHLDYELVRDDQRIGAWSDTLRWNATRFAFERFQTTTTLPSPLVEMIRQRMNGVRDYVLAHPLDMAAPVTETEIGTSGLMNVLEAACDPW